LQQADCVAAKQIPGSRVIETWARGTAAPLRGCGHHSAQAARRERSTNFLKQGFYRESIDAEIQILGLNKNCRMRQLFHLLFMKETKKKG
jgi:hypothetical protein